MPSDTATIAEAVKDSLNAATFSQAFEATRRYVPAVRLEDMGDDLHVTVVARADARSNAARRVVRREVDIDVGIQKRLTTDCDPAAEGGNDELDALLTLAEEVAGHFTPAMAPLTGTGGHWVRTAHDPIYDPDHLLDQRVFTSLVTVTFVLFDT